MSDLLSLEGLEEGDTKKEEKNDQVVVLKKRKLKRDAGRISENIIEGETVDGGSSNSSNDGSTGRPREGETIGGGTEKNEEGFLDRVSAVELRRQVKRQRVEALESTGALQSTKSTRTSVAGEENSGRDTLGNVYSSNRDASADARGMVPVAVALDMSLVESLSETANSAKRQFLIAAQTNRGHSMVEYQMPICKDFKETGRCGYGDACKYLHDRSDYKSGAQLEADYAREQEIRRRRAMGEQIDEELLTGPKRKNEFLAAMGSLGMTVKGVNMNRSGGSSGGGIGVGSTSGTDNPFPTVCPICQGEFVDPVESTCKHYFCERCALKQDELTQKCFTCGKKSDGVFNTATKLINWLASRDKKG